MLLPERLPTGYIRSYILKLLPVGIHDAGQLRPQCLGIPGNAHPLQWMIVGMSRLRACRREPLQSEPLLLHIFGSHFCQEACVKGGNIRFSPQLFVFTDQNIQGASTGKGAVQLPGVSIQLPSKVSCLLCS